MQYILTDIEGTTTSVSFVYEVLFPYFKKNLGAILIPDLDQPYVRENIEAVKQTVEQEEGKTLSDEEVIAQLVKWTEADRKHTAMKNLQGYVWKEGYLKGELKGHVYADVPPVLEKWRQAGKQMGVYSSGSVTAQKLIFGRSVFGDLTPYFSHYFDTQVGHKREPASYENIQKEIGIPASEILFLSDVEAELDAAQAAGYQTLQLVREGTSASEKHPTAPGFSEIDI